MIDRNTQRDVSLPVSTRVEKLKKLFRSVLGIVVFLVKSARVVDVALRWVHKWLADL